MPAYDPTPADVKALIPARMEGRPFGPTTVPTDVQVTEVIANISTEVTTHMGTVPIADAQHPLAKYTIAMGAAAEVERSFWPEQHDLADTSTYARLIRRYRELLELLVYAVTGEPIEGVDGATSKKVKSTKFLSDTGTYVVDEELLP